MRRADRRNDCEDRFWTFRAIGLRTARAVRTGAAHQRWNLRAQELGRVGQILAGRRLRSHATTMLSGRATPWERPKRPSHETTSARRRAQHCHRGHVPTPTLRLPSRPERCVMATNVWKRAGALRSSAAICSGVRDHDIPFRLGDTQRGDSIGRILADDPSFDGREKGHADGVVTGASGPSREPLPPVRRWLGHGRHLGSTCTR